MGDNRPEAPPLAGGIFEAFTPEEQKAYEQMEATQGAFFAEPQPAAAPEPGASPVPAAPSAPSEPAPGAEPPSSPAPAEREAGELPEPRAREPLPTEPGASGEVQPVGGKLAPESGEATQDGEKDDLEGLEHVPVYVVRDVRGRLKGVQAENAEMRARLDQQNTLLARMAEREQLISRIEEGRQQAARAAAEAAAAPKETPPDPELDPLGHSQFQQKRLEREIVELKGMVERQAQQQAVNAEAGWVERTATELRMAFVKDNPDYDQALAFLEAARGAQFKLLFPNENDAQIAERVKSEKAAIVLASLTREPNGALRFFRSPPEVVYGIAKTMGWQPAVAQNGAERASANGNGQVAARPTTATPERRQAAAARSLGAVSGSGAPAGEIDSVQLSTMPQGEFNKLLKENPDLVYRLMGKGLDQPAS